MANATNLPGIIGQVYEDRRNGDSGKLISRDEKCKTLTFQSDDGNSFVKSYSHFRSYMRKKADVPEEEIKEEAYAEAELTSVEVSEADAVKMEKNAKRKAKAAEKANKSEVKKAIISDEDKEKIYEDMINTIQSFVDSFNNASITCSRRDYKKSCSIKIKGRSMMICYSRAKNQSVYITSIPQFVSDINHSVTLKNNRHHDAKTANYRTESYVIEASDLKANLEDLRESIVEIVSFVKEKESEA